MLIPQTDKAIQKIGVKESSVLKNVDSILEESGFIEPVRSTSIDRSNSEAKSALIQRGATLDNVLDNMIGLMNHAENESVRMKAIENSLAIHGVNLKNQESNQRPVISINFQNVENGPQRLDSILCPER